MVLYVPLKIFHFYQDGQFWNSRRNKNFQIKTRPQLNLNLTPLNNFATLLIGTSFCGQKNPFPLCLTFSIFNVFPKFIVRLFYNAKI